VATVAGVTNQDIAGWQALHVGIVQVWDMSRAVAHFLNTTPRPSEQWDIDPTERPVFQVQGDGEGLNIYVKGKLNGRFLHLLCDTGASCSCLSLKYFNRHLRHNTQLLPKTNSRLSVSANNSFLDIVGIANSSLLLGNKTTNVKFLVMNDLSQDAILGSEFLSSTRTCQWTSRW